MNSKTSLNDETAKITDEATSKLQEWLKSLKEKESWLVKNVYTKPNFWSITDEIIENPWLSYNEILLKEAVRDSNHWAIIPYAQEIKYWKNSKEDENLKWKKGYNEVLFRYKSNTTQEVHWPWLLDDISDNTLDQVLLNLINTTYKANKKWKFSFNFSKWNILSDEVLKTLKRLIEQGDLNPKDMVIEILEDVTNDIFFKTILKKYKDLGFLIAMDDFWSKNSNYSNLLDYSNHWLLDIVKIDRMFFQKHKDNPALKELIEEFHWKWLEVVIEGIEDEKDYKLSLLLWVQYTQWYFHWKPKSI